MIRLIKSLLTEHGLKWLFYRSLYSVKLKLMSKISVAEKIFEKKVSVKKIDIFNFDILAIKKFLEKLEESKKKSIISIADKAIKGIIKVFSSIELDYGDPINWHLNPLTGFEFNRNLKWYKIKDFGPEFGDIKVIWEASRLTHFLYFSRAYLITEDPKYYEAFSMQLEEWLKNNPYSYGVNYKCGQETTLRILNVLMVYSVFNYHDLTTNRDKENVIKLIEASYKKILSNFFYAHKCIKNNHTFSEILGLIVGAWCCEDKKMVQKAYKLMDKEIKSQFLEDGGFTQYSFNYHRFVLQIIEFLYKVSEKTGIFITEKNRIKNSVLFLYQVQEKNGDVPNYGSNDGSLIFPTLCGYRDFRPVLNTMYALLKGKRLYNYGCYDEELLWFAGEKLYKNSIYLKKKSIGYEKSGLYTLRSEDRFLMVVLQNF
jgi:hypothetical protein